MYMMAIPWQQKPGQKTGKPGEVWFNQAYQAFGLKSSLVKSLVSLVLPHFLGKVGEKLPKKPGKSGFGTQTRT